ncbi:ileal sodium/bile acid cotransporter-like [Acanthaster planci]|uniref:Ileal sodium/bile acid cotransporter-like n=1 Tax=Acanthaster planci TaxID=133434 RepID=A0A8B7XNS2_ACAPL|nr:ileal sodium/bile acid cotransporter-like [Acanthaster planci]
MTDASPEEGLPKYAQALREANKVIVIFLVVVIMLAVGCVVTVDDFKSTLRRPVGVIIGFLSQFVVLPLTAFGLAHALKLNAAYALGLLVSATCPGGVTSNLFAYWMDGDVCLSITMTTLSTVAAMGMMPLNLFLYGRSWTSESVVIPYSNIAIALALTLVPVAAGMLIKYRKPSWCKIITLLGSIFGFLAIFFTISSGGIIDPSMFASPWQVWFAGAIQPLLGYALGYFFALALRRPHAECRTISIETGTQNIGLALVLLLVTFQGSDQLNNLLVIPNVYRGVLALHSLWLTGLYLAWKRWCRGVSGAQDHHGSPLAQQSEEPGKDRCEMENYNHTE